MINSYDREELVSRFGRPRPDCGLVQVEEPEVPIKPLNELLGKPPKPLWFDRLDDGVIAIKPNCFKGLCSDQTTQPTQTTKSEHWGQRGFIRDFPADWHAVLNELQGSTPVDGFGDTRWQFLVNDTEVFLARWGEAAHLLGWTALDLFGVHPAAPGLRFDVMGLLPLLQGDSVVALTNDEAKIRRPSKAVLTFRRANQASAVLVTRCRH